jgi:NADH dehydrogenase FAD-containing subunit
MTLPTVILAGCGYGAIPSLRTLRGQANVIAINPYPYLVNSGMTPRLLSGRFTLDLVKIPLYPHIQTNQAQYLQGRVTQVFPLEKQVVVQTETEEDRSEVRLAYDLLLLNVGREVEKKGIPGLDYAFTVRPIEHLVAARQWIQQCWHRAEAGDRSPGLLTFCVIGGGLTGVELMGELYNLCQDLSQQTRIPLSQCRLILLSRGKIAAGMSKSFADLIDQALKIRSVELIPEATVVELTPTAVSFWQHQERVILPTLTKLWAGGLKVGSWLQESGLPVGEDGSLRVDPYFRVEGQDSIFAMGDCAYFQTRSGDPLPRFGVYAVRSGPVVAQNLLSTLQQRPLKVFHPQSSVFISVTVGNRIGICQKGNWIHQGYLATVLKNSFDWLYMRQVKSVRWQDFLIDSV